MQTKRYGLWENLGGHRKLLVHQSDNLDEVKFTLERALYKSYEAMAYGYENGDFAQKPGTTYEAIEALRETSDYEIYDDEKETVVQ